MIFVTFTCPFWQMVFSPEGSFFWVIERWEIGVRCKQTFLMLINVCKAIFVRRSTACSKTTNKPHVNWVCAGCLYHLTRLHHHLSRIHRSWNNWNTWWSFVTNQNFHSCLRVLSSHLKKRQLNVTLNMKTYRSNRGLQNLQNIVTCSFLKSGRLNST